MSQILRPLRANLGAIAAVSVGAGFIYAYAQPKRSTVFGGFNPQYLRLESVEEVAHNMKRLRFAYPNADDESGLPLTSSLLTLSTPASRLLPVLRPYTPITTPTTRGHLDLLIKRYPHGAASPYLHSLSPGDRLLFLAAIPGYAWKPNAFKRITCIAGGAGVTPVAVVLEGEWEGLVRAAGGRVRVVHVVGDGEGGMKEGWREGWVTKELLRELGVERREGGQDQSEMVFVCGPPGMEEMLVGKGRGGGGGVLAELGFGRDRVHRF
ncbi:NADH-cytochrome b5 reductase 2 [Diplodia seriata]|uniref:NADH-cytochrome b5 reductase 2 n=1 Tax=Diplodia seriata TaxID=420778 RepID=A0A1S8BBP5_9PEZI|nr:NADH-cytochrome b5 reductase 2 [Diplodia seriata]